jgi:hypothetical protein
MAIPDELVKKIAEQLAAQIINILPAAFLVYDEDMKILMRLVALVEKDKDAPLDPKDRQHILDVLKHVWDRSKMISHNDMDLIVSALEAQEKKLEAERAEHEAKETKDET